MLFNSYIFMLAFLPLTLLGYYGFNYAKQYKLAQAYLIGMSLWFYGYNNIYYLAILVVSVLVNYAISVLMFQANSANKVRKRALLAAGVVLNIGILFYFKYYDFFIENMNVLLKKDYNLLHIVLPLGISFYTFQQLSFVIDCYKEECERYSFLEYAAYVTFFPQLIAGPIVYHSELIPQFRAEENRRLNYENLSKGIYAFTLGLAKKVLLADTFSKIVTVGYGNIPELSSLNVVTIMVSYSLQIYFDFSGYCDMAYGIGYMFNVELPINFNSPYKALSIADFWDCWHMTLTRFFTKYIYIPLGGSRKGKIRTYINVMIVFLVSGFWHGASWTFVIWGVLHGVFMVGHRLFGKYLEKLPKAVRWCGTFSLVTFLWSLFRANTIFQARALWDHLWYDWKRESFTALYTCLSDNVEWEILGRVGFSTFLENQPWIFVTLLILLVMLACLFMRNTQEKVKTMKLSVGRIVSIAFLFMWSLLSLSSISEFLYFNF